MRCNRLIANDDQLKNAKFISSLIEKITELRPNKAKYKWHRENSFGTHSICIDKLVKIQHTHRLNETDEAKINQISISKCKNGVFRPVVEGNRKPGIHADDEVGVEEFSYGKEYHMGDFKRKLYDNIHTHCVWYTAFGDYEVIEFTHVGTLDYLIVAHKGVISLFIEFESEDTCYQYLPVSVKSDGTLNYQFLTTISTVLGVVGSVYLYFGSLPLTLFIITVSFGLLSLSSSMNPKQRPVVRVIQIILYAIVFIFLR